jgi:hypothetical protein
MRLTGNKEGISHNKVVNVIYWKEDNIRNSDINIWDKQDIDIHTVTTSNYLTYNIYHDINRE